MSDEQTQWAQGSANLAPWCRHAASEASALLKSAVCEESKALSAQGFVVPSCESLMHASDVFAHIAALPGGEYWFQCPDPPKSMQLICALSGAIDGLEAQWDLSALSSWWAWRDTQTALKQADAARRMVNSGLLQQAIALLEADMERAEREYGVTR